MRKRIFSWLLPALGCAILISCGERAAQNMEAMNFDNALTVEELSAGLLTPEVMWKMGRVGGEVLSPDGKELIYTVTRYDMSANQGQTNLMHLTVGETLPVQITDGAGNESSVSWNGAGDHIYYLSDRGGSNQLWSATPQGSDATQLSNVEGGIEAYGISPTGNKLFYVKRVPVEKRNSSEIYSDLDKSKVKVYDDLMVRHWNYWDDGSFLHIFVTDLNNSTIGEGIDIMAAEAWDAPMAPYFDGAEIAWNNVGTQLAYTCKKMGGKAYATSTNSDIYLYDVATSTTRNLTEGMMGYDRYPRFSPDNSKVAFTSMEHDGNESDKDRLFVVNLSDGAKTYLTADFDYNATNVAWQGNDLLYFIAPMNATHQVCRVGLNQTPVDVVTQGSHDLNSFTLAGDRLVASHTTLSSPSELFEVDLQAGKLTQLTNTNPEIYTNIKMGQVEERLIKTTDGKEMLTWVVLPPNFDPNQKYPALLYCQGGPQSVVSQFWSYRWNLQLMAAQGYIVVAPNRRGLPSFGQEWLDQISGDYSGQNISDYLSAIDAVAAEPYVDKDRLGCVGASYGGYSAYYLAGNHKKRFKAFIAHCGMFNFESMYGSTEELWFPTNDLGGSYWSDDATAKRSYANSPHRFVKNWDTPILIMVGLNDFRIPYTESLQAFTAAKMQGVPARLITFENEAHQVFKPQNSLVWNREFFGWLDKYLKE